jgi:hypothetical protein
MRATLAVIAGVLAGMVAMMAVAYVGDMLFPTPAARAAGGAIEQATSAFANTPLQMRLCLVLAWFVGGLIAGVVAKLIVRDGRIAWTAIAILTVLTAINIFILPYPVWMEIANVLAPLVGGLVGNHLVAARTETPEPGGES